MRIFIYEYVTGGGLSDGATSPVLAGMALLAEGRAMAAALTTDFCLLPGFEVWTTRDRRLGELHPRGCRAVTIGNSSEEEQAIKRLAADADWTLLIAPETDGALLKRCEVVIAAGGRLLSPGRDVIAIAGNKEETAKVLTGRGVPVPRGGILQTNSVGTAAERQFSIVVKPLDGCGSESVRLIRGFLELSAEQFNRMMRWEEFVPGMAASVAVLCGPRGNVSLPACRQRLSTDGQFTYLGGRLPLLPEQDKRARRLAEAAAGALPNPLGYIGVDLILGGAVDGSRDRVIEINPRLTTSYVGLRAACKTNLAAAMLMIARGDSADLCFESGPVEFLADGTITQSPDDRR